jgi:hypothetical protein
MIAEFLNLETGDAADLFIDARSYVFIKILPRDRLTLHDEMRRMVDRYVLL